MCLWALCETEKWAKHKYACSKIMCLWALCETDITGPTINTSSKIFFYKVYDMLKNIFKWIIILKWLNSSNLISYNSHQKI